MSLHQADPRRAIADARAASTIKAGPVHPGSSAGCVWGSMLLHDAAAARPNSLTASSRLACLPSTWPPGGSTWRWAPFERSTGDAAPTGIAVGEGAVWVAERLGDFAYVQRYDPRPDIATGADPGRRLRARHRRRRRSRVGCKSHVGHHLAHRPGDEYHRRADPRRRRPDRRRGRGRIGLGDELHRRHRVANRPVDEPGHHDDRGRSASRPRRRRRGRRLGDGALAMSDGRDRPADRLGAGRLPDRGAARPGRDGRRLPGGGPALERKVALKLLAPELAEDDALPGALPARVAARRLDRPPERDPDLRSRRGRRAALHRHALRRGHRPQGSSSPTRGASSRPHAIAILGQVAERARRRPRARARPPRRQARQRPDRREGGRPRLPGRLRPDQAGVLGLRAHRDRPVRRHRRLRRPRADRARAGRPGRPTSTRSPASSTSASPGRRRSGATR